MSELRQDLVSGDWIIMAPERGGKRPHDLAARREKRKSSPESTCPFEDPKRSGNWPPIAAYPDEEKWEMILIPNKYPALTHTPLCAPERRHGPNSYAAGSGHHDLLVTRDHHKNFSNLSVAEGVRLFEVLQERYRTLASDRCLLYTATFFNWGAGAGASLYHPHYQILTLPVVPTHVQHSLEGSRRYFQKHGRCPHCATIAWERKEKKRVIDENAGAISFSPFAPFEPFALKVLTKRHISSFEKTAKKDLRSIVQVLQSTLRRVTKYLHDPDYNFFIHTTPLKHRERYPYYHWHIEVTPKIQVPGGFEVSTGMDINVVDPDRAAAILRGKKNSS
ncbi:DUF4921 family protein [Candidatus Parcubacteria bacterium]|nr:MAG: DUF4921 family protein [Candidatus Parcubacteria bacterium]